MSGTIWYRIGPLHWRALVRHTLFRAWFAVPQGRHESEHTVTRLQDLQFDTTVRDTIMVLLGAICLLLIAYMRCVRMHTHICPPVLHPLPVVQVEAHPGLAGERSGEARSIQLCELSGMGDTRYGKGGCGGSLGMCGSACESQRVSSKGSIHMPSPGAWPCI